jgi:hypothetical protein
MSGHDATFYSVANEKNGMAAINGRQSISFAGTAVEGWRMASMVASGIDITIFKVAPNALYGSHSAPFECVCFVADGAGELFLSDAEGRELGAVDCKKGDAYLQGANTLHGFRNGPLETTLIYLHVV